MPANDNDDNNNGCTQTGTKRQQCAHIKCATAKTYFARVRSRPLVLFVLSVRVCRLARSGSQRKSGITTLSVRTDKRQTPRKPEYARYANRPSDFDQFAIDAPEFFCFIAHSQSDMLARNLFCVRARSALAKCARQKPRLCSVGLLFVESFRTNRFRNQCKPIDTVRKIMLSQSDCLAMQCAMNKGWLWFRALHTFGARCLFVRAMRPTSVLVWTRNWSRGCLTSASIREI